jgi:hypothetical protein
MAVTVIVSFVVIFFGAILWASRRPVETHH